MKKKYLVALSIDNEGSVDYGKYQIIEAESPEDAVDIYNEKNKCKYFYGAYIGEIDEEKGMVSVPLKIFNRLNGKKII